MGDIQDYLVWKHENKKEVFHCGECLFFTHEMTDGEGICFLDNSMKYCGDVACNSFKKEHYRELKFIREDEDNILSVFIDDNNVRLLEEGDDYRCSITLSMSELKKIIENLENETNKI